MEERKTPSTGQIYRHFKNNLYQIITIAINEATREEMVVYQALYGDYGIYVRTLTNFMEPVDKLKYKEATQQYRFEVVDKKSLIEQREINTKSVVSNFDISQLGDEPIQEQTRKQGTIQTIPSQVQEDIKKGKKEDIKEVESEVEELQADPKLLAFCEADTFLEKYEMLKSFRGELSDRLINDLAVVLDVVIPEGELEKRYEALLKCLQTFCKFEVNRLR